MSEVGCQIGSVIQTSQTRISRNKEGQTSSVAYVYNGTEVEEKVREPNDLRKVYLIACTNLNLSKIGRWMLENGLKLAQKNVDIPPILPRKRDQRAIAYEKEAPKSTCAHEGTCAAQ